MAAGHGGRRTGSGRKPKSAQAQAMDGDTGHRKVLRHPNAADPALPPIEEFDAPDSLTFEEWAVWLRMAPHAFAARTLTRASMEAFCRYCQLRVREEKERQSSGADGAVHKWQQTMLNKLELQFSLTPCGKPMESAAPAAASEQKKTAYW